LLNPPDLPLDLRIKVLHAQTHPVYAERHEVGREGGVDIARIELD
jgi:hypothetical protein